MADQSTGPIEAAKPPRAERKALMLSATIEAGPLKAPVRIRNLSESGAMIEGVALPPVGSATTLQRNEIEIGGSVVWQSGRRAGIHFNGAVSVEEWIAGVKKPPEAMRGQTRVDAIQAAARAGQPVVESTPVERTARAEVTEIDTAIADEIALRSTDARNCGQRTRRRSAHDQPTRGRLAELRYSLSDPRPAGRNHFRRRSICGHRSHRDAGLALAPSSQTAILIGCGSCRPVLRLRAPEARGRRWPVQPDLLRDTIAPSM